MTNELDLTQEEKALPRLPFLAQILTQEEKAPEPMVLGDIEEAVLQGQLEDLPPPKHLYSAEDIVDACVRALDFHRNKTDFFVPSSGMYDDPRWLNDRIKEVVSEAARPNPEVVFNRWHDAWLAMQLKDGWQYGEEYHNEHEIGSQPDYSASPLIMPFLFTPPEYQAMGHIFWNTVRGLMHFWDRT